MKPAAPEVRKEPVAPPQLAAIEPEPAPQAGPRVPDFQGMTMRAVLTKSGAEGWRVETEGSGIARGQLPVPGAAVSGEKRVRVLFRQ